MRETEYLNAWEFVCFYACECMFVCTQVFGRVFIFCACLRMCVSVLDNMCVCVCVREREREREGDKRERERGRLHDVTGN